MKKHTIKQVATLAGVSIATVSRVINGSDKVSSIAEEKVKTAIDKLNYTPNSIARSLKTKQSKIIGVMAVDLYIPFFSSVIHNLEKNLKNYGYNMFISCHHDDGALERRCLDTMLEMQVDAIITTPTGYNDEYLAKINNSGVKVLCLDRTPKCSDIPAIYTDKINGFYALGEHLYNLGHRKFSLVTGNQCITSNQARLLGVSNFIKAKKLPTTSLSCYYGEFVGTEEFGYKTAEKIFSLPKIQQPTALILGNTTITAGFLKSSYEHNLKIPRDISLVCLGNFYMADLIPLKLTYMDDQPIDLGKLGAKMINNILIAKSETASNQNNIHKADIILPYKIIYGSSTSKPLNLEI